MSVISMSAEDEHHVFGTVEPTKGTWYPIETAPKNGTNILVVWDGVVEIAWWNAVVGNWQGFPYEDFAIGKEVTHWMPLPEPPK